jgi:hypothetical protein
MNVEILFRINMYIVIMNIGVMYLFSGFIYGLVFIIHWRRQVKLYWIYISIYVYITGINHFDRYESLIVFIINVINASKDFKRITDKSHFDIQSLRTDSHWDTFILDFKRMTDIEL